METILKELGEVAEGVKTADAIYVAGAGTIVITDDSDVVTTVTLIAGATFPCIAKRIASASTATGIVALYE